MVMLSGQVMQASTGCLHSNMLVSKHRQSSALLGAVAHASAPPWRGDRPVCFPTPPVYIPVLHEKRCVVCGSRVGRLLIHGDCSGTLATVHAALANAQHGRMRPRRICCSRSCRTGLQPGPPSTQARHCMRLPANAAENGEVAAGPLPPLRSEGRQGATPDALFEKSRLSTSRLT